MGGGGGQSWWFNVPYYISHTFWAHEIVLVELWDIDLASMLYYLQDQGVLGDLLLILMGILN